MNRQTDTFGATKIAVALKNRMVSGEVRLGAYLSSIRLLSHEFGCAPMTAQRALRMLSEEGLVVAEPRRGYRVTRQGAAPQALKTLAFVEVTTDWEPYLGDIYNTQISVLQREALRRGWVATMVPYSGQAPQRVAEQLRKMDATALIVQDVGENFTPEFLQMLAALGLPMIGLDLASGAPGIDLVLRHEFHGAQLAAAYLIKKGHRRIGWYGPLRSTFNARRRFAGAAEELMRADLGIDAQRWREIEHATETAVAREYLQSPHRPKAVLALWQSSALALARAARELGLKLGQDLDVVGWALDEQLGVSYPAECEELLSACATITWSMADVGQLVFNRIEERLRDPGVPVANILLPMKLRETGRAMAASSPLRSE